MMSMATTVCARNTVTYARAIVQVHGQTGPLSRISPPPPPPPHRPGRRLSLRRPLAPPALAPSSRPPSSCTRVLYYRYRGRVHGNNTRVRRAQSPAAHYCFWGNKLEWEREESSSPAVNVVNVVATVAHVGLP